MKREIKYSVIISSWLVATSFLPLANAIQGAYQCGHYKTDGKNMLYGSDVQSCNPTCTGGKCTVGYVSVASICSGGVDENLPRCKYCSEYHDDGFVKGRKYQGYCDVANSDPLVCGCYVSDFSNPIQEQDYPSLYAVGGRNCSKCPAH